MVPKVSYSMKRQNTAGKISPSRILWNSAGPRLLLPPGRCELRMVVAWFGESLSRLGKVPTGAGTGTAAYKK